MSWPAVLLTPRRRRLALFTAAELVLAMAIPFVAIAGYHALLESRAGRFVQPPTEGDPGWRAVVDPSPVTAVVESHRGETTGIVLLAGHPEEAMGGAVIIVPGTLNIDGAPLAGRDPAGAIDALASALRLRVDAVEVVTDERWDAVLGNSSYRLANPDPVVDDAGEPLLGVGEVQLQPDVVGLFLGRPAPESDPITLLFRRELFWTAMLEDPPSGSDPVAELVREMGGPGSRVVRLPLEAVEADPVPDLVAAEALVREVVPIPAGPEPGDRLRLRVIDRTGSADLETVAATAASTGAEVVEIGNAAEFDGGGTHLVVPAGVEDPVITELATLTGATTVLDNAVDADGVATLLVGIDYPTQR